MIEIIIDKEFQSIVTPLKEEESSLLEKSLLEEGCRETLIIWKQKILDGYHRYKICKEHNIDFKIKEINLPDKESAINWIINNQLGKRNITSEQKSYLRGFRYEREKTIGHGKKTVGQNVPQITSERLSKEYKVTSKTIKRDGNYVKAINKIAETDKKIKNPILMGELKTTKNEILQLSRKDKITQKRIIKKVKRQKISISEATREVKKEDLDIESKTASDKKYRIIYADPPWKYEATLPHKYGDVKKEYPVMTIDEICKYPETISLKIEDDAVLFLWVTSPKLELAFKIIEAWGFEYKTSFVWDKVKHNLGYYNSIRHEFLLIGGRGSSVPDSKKRYDSVVSIERSKKHSEKPAYFRDLIDSLYTWGHRIELFWRRKVEEVKEGWDVFGNE